MPPEIKGGDLCDVATFKYPRARQDLLSGPDCAAIAADLPIHFFTIVLNGEPFIRYHEKMLCSLPFKWHWHVVEGVAALRHDTAWSTAFGGRILDSAHHQGRSVDGTSEYLDDMSARLGNNVTLYRKPLGEFWDGKREMINAPLPNIQGTCLLWQIDADELWTADQIVEMRRQFISNPDRQAAYYWCWYFVTPNKVISTRYNYAQNPAQEWLRTWRLQPGDLWSAHEPPTLVRPSPEGQPPINLAALAPFTHEETEAFGAVFQHFAYATEAQVKFKESYYGYSGAVAQWRSLLDHDGPGALSEYFAWVKDKTLFDEATTFRVRPLALHDPVANHWSFASPTGQQEQAPVPVRPRIVIDGIYWQYLSSGIGRVWRSLLEEWVVMGLADHFVVLDRAGSAPRIPGVHYRSISAYDYGQSAQDSLYLDRICRELGTDLFVSTYYSTTTEIPSFFFGYDMIPEMTGVDLTDEVWQEKARAIRHAAGHLMISHNSARDLAKCFPEVVEDEVAIAHCGLPSAFDPASPEEIAVLRGKMKLPERYALLVGDRNGVGGYKNGILAFKAAALIAARGTPIGLVCAGGLPDIDPAHRDAAPRTDILRVRPDDSQLRLLYAGATALLYPSRYEGFGMPVLEAMACGCPVITCRNSSLAEVGGEAAIYVDPDDASAMADAMLMLSSDPYQRAERIRRGLEQAARFTVRRQAETTMAAFRATVAALNGGTRARPGKGWVEFRRYQAGIQAWVAEGQREAKLTPTTAAEPIPAPPRPSGELLRLMQELDAIKNSPFWRLRGLAVGCLRTLGLRHRS